MTARRDPDQFIKAYLEEGLTELPDRAYDAVRSEIDHTRQRVVIGPWRVPNMNNFARFAIAAAAISGRRRGRRLCVAQDGRHRRTRGHANSVSEIAPSPTISANPLPEADALAPGTYYIGDRTITNATRFIFTVPAGWASNGGEVFKDRSERPTARSCSAHGSSTASLEKSASGEIQPSTLERPSTAGSCAGGTDRPNRVGADRRDGRWLPRQANRARHARPGSHASAMAEPSSTGWSRSRR